MAFSAVYDANVLYPNVLCEALIRVCVEGLVGAHWTEAILDEAFRSLAANRPDIPAGKLQRTRELMCAALPAAIITDYEDLIAGLALPDPDDRHVLAAAIRAGAQMIVTFNLKDFPADRLGRFDVEAKSPDDFLVDQFFIDHSVVRGVIRDIARSRTRPATTEAAVTDELDQCGAPRFAALLRS